MSRSPSYLHSVKPICKLPCRVMPLSFSPVTAQGPEYHAAAVVAVLVPSKQCHMVQFENLSKCVHQVVARWSHQALTIRNVKACIPPQLDFQRSKILGVGHGTCVTKSSRREALWEAVIRLLNIWSRPHLNNNTPSQPLSLSSHPTTTV